MFTPEDRDRARHHILAAARAEARIVAAAEVGGSATDGDRWSDLDLTFGIASGAEVRGVIDDLTKRVRAELGARQLFDLPFLSSVYRVFLLPGNLQVDLSFTPAGEFGALGPRFRLLWGEAVQRTRPPDTPAAEVFGLAVHHAVRARISIERGKLWQAAHWITHMRELALVLACRRAGLEASNGRGLDQLPRDVLALAEESLIGDVDLGALRRALTAAVELLRREGLAEASTSALASAVATDMAELGAPGPLE